MHRRTTMTTLFAAACVLALIVVSTLLALRAHQPAPAAAAGAPMSHVVAAPINGDATLTDTTWGTRIDLRCTYSATASYLQVSSYILVVIDTAGQPQPQPRTWFPMRFRRSVPPPTSATRTSAA